MERIYFFEQRHETRCGWWKRILKGIVSLWPNFSSFSRDSSSEKNERPGLRRSLCVPISLIFGSSADAVSNDVATIMNPRSGQYKLSSSFPKIQPHAPNTIQTPSLSDLTYTGRIKQTLWALSAKLKERNLKYAIKAGMATAMLAAPAFFDATRPIFTEYRGEWALISVNGFSHTHIPYLLLTTHLCQFFVVISPTIGAVCVLSPPKIDQRVSFHSADEFYECPPDFRYIVREIGIDYPFVCSFFPDSGPEPLLVSTHSSPRILLFYRYLGSSSPFHVSITSSPHRNMQHQVDSSF